MKQITAYYNVLSRLNLSIQMLNKSLVICKVYIEREIKLKILEKEGHRLLY